MKNTPEKWAGPAKAGKNYQADQRQYADFVNVLGGKAPKTFAKFQDLKYNDKESWEKLCETKHQTQTVKAAPCMTTPKKFTEYFLKPGAKHAEQFFDVGYSTDDPLRLRYDMARQFDMSKAVEVKDLSGGARRFNIYMELGVTKKRLFVTGWVQDTPDSKPRIVTSFRKNEGRMND